ncbi:hypothetical protein [Variovorax gossypii]
MIDDAGDARPPDGRSAAAGFGAGPVLGEWYRVVVDKTPRPGEEQYCAEERARLAREREDWLGCAMKIGSNYVLVESPPDHRGSSRSIRVHFENFWTRLRHEPNADQVIRARVGRHQQEAKRLMAEVQEVTQRLGMANTAAIAHSPAAAAGSAGGALMVLSSQADPRSYGRALKLAKETTLPELFKAIKVEHGELACWMKAPSMAMRAMVADESGLIEEIDDRIFSVGLYAGLAEEATLVADGMSAAMLDRLHVMQGMAFCDEECLARWEEGGMEFKDLGAFDAWLARPENRDRILPFPRTLVAMRVRRNEKKRDSEGSISKALVNMELGEFDKSTFLYVRNGEQLWRITTEVDFDPMIFPDPSVFDPNEPKMYKPQGFSSERKFMSVSEWEQEIAEEKAREAKNRGDSWYREKFRAADWVPLDHSSVYHDDGMKLIERQIKDYNRVALIIQGLFDRSMTLHPHPPVQTWTSEGFDRAVKLVYDATGVLHNGEAPDFEAYRSRCNATLGVGSMVVGQDDFWQRKEGEKESLRITNDWRNKSGYRPERFKPYGNPGPGYVARAERWSKTKGATFTWERKRLGDPRSRYQRDESPVTCTLTVPAHELLNVDAYQLGDFKQFFNDPRTRVNYLKWAPLLIAAEQHHLAKARE